MRANIHLDYDDEIVEPCDCALCDVPILGDEPILVFEPFDADSDLVRYFDLPMHWDCYANWEHRRRMARQWFDACTERLNDNPYWGIARLDDEVQISVNPDRDVRRVDVLLAATGTLFLVRLDDWQDWLQRGWRGECRHDVERQALSALLPSLRADLPTAKAIVEAARMLFEWPWWEDGER